MNEKSNHNLPTNQNLSYAVRQAIEYEQRIAFVESICAELNDDPFGAAREYRTVTDLRFGPDRGAIAFCDLTFEGPVFSNEIIRKKLESINCGAAAAHANPLSPSTQPRGSPEIFQGRRPLAISEGKNH